MPTVPADVPTTGPNVNGPGERPPVEPVTATQHSAAGAKAFAEFFIRTIDWGYATTSSAYMRHYFEPSCEQCEVVARLLDNAHRSGDHYIGGRIALKSSQVLAFEPVPTVDLHLLVTADEVIDSHGKPKDADVAYPNLRERISLTWDCGRWVIKDMRGDSS
jgi:hypothetical protein